MFMTSGEGFVRICSFTKFLGRSRCSSMSAWKPASSAREGSTPVSSRYTSSS